MGATTMQTSVLAAWALLLAGVAAPATAADLPALPKKPVTITIVDVAGDLTYTKQIWENYRKANPDKVAAIEYQTTNAPQLPAKLMAQQQANRLDTALVLSGFDAMAAGIEKGLWLKVHPDYDARFPGLDAQYLDGAKQIGALADGFGVTLLYSPSGPLLAYNPDVVKTPPTTVDELKTWIKDHPNRFFYPRPANSGPGRTFLMGLPYLLGDKDPKDPDKGWDKTWAFLQEIDKSIEYYTPGTAALIKEYGQGGRDMTVTTVGWDIQMRSSQTVPKHFKTAFLKDFVWVADAHFMLVPKGLDADRLAVVLDMMAWALKPDQQAYAYTTGGFYPGPAIKGVTLDKAPAEVREPLAEFLRPEYDPAIAKGKTVPPLAPAPMVAAFAKWDTLIGAKTQATH
jgi:putative spermidine/putrescine transport system substrate-binding protein